MMNPLSVRLSWLLCALVIVQMLLPAQAGFEIKKLFERKGTTTTTTTNNNNNNKEDDASKVTNSKKGASETLMGAGKRDRADERLDEQLQQVSEAKQQVRARVDLAKIRAAAADADRIAAKAAGAGAAASTATASRAVQQPQDELEPEGDEYDEYDEQKGLPKPPTTIGRRRKPLVGVTRPTRPVPGSDSLYKDQKGSNEVKQEEEETQVKRRASRRGQQTDDNDDDDDKGDDNKDGGGDGKMVATGRTSGQAIDKSQLRPTIRARIKNLPGTSGAAKFFGDGASKPKSKLFSATYLKGKMSKGVKQVAGAISEIPHLVEQATDSVSAMLQLDSKGRLLSMIEEVNGDIHFVKKEFSKFSITWSPIMEKALNYLGDTDLDKIKWKNKDELDFRNDALHSLVFGYEFMRLMMGWRENLLVAHEAYKLYLETIKKEMLDSSKPSINVDENFIFQMKTIHAYMLLTSWLTVDEVSREPRMKLDHLMEVEDDRPKNYESEYFRNIIVLQELYEPARTEFDEERKQVEDAIGHAGALTDDFQDVDKFFDEFRNNLASNEVKGIDWEAPQELYDFMQKLRPQLQYNPLVYSRSFKKEILEALQRASSNDNEA